MQIERDRLVRVLWELGFEYVTNTGAAQVFWRGSNAHHIIEVPKAETVDYAWAIDSLVRCGIRLSDAEDALGKHTAAAPSPKSEDKS